MLLQISCLANPVDAWIYKHLSFYPVNNITEICFAGGSVICWTGFRTINAWSSYDRTENNVSPSRRCGTLLQSAIVAGIATEATGKLRQHHSGSVHYPVVKWCWLFLRVSIPNFSDIFRIVSCSFMLSTVIPLGLHSLWKGAKKCSFNIWSIVAFYCVLQVPYYFSCPMLFEPCSRTFLGLSMRAGYSLFLLQWIYQN